ncbi:MAG: PAS domain S-box protein [Spirochaetota bacterium]|nr:PAS domain S-box protein [Spirochaetota bacterium]
MLLTLVHNITLLIALSVIWGPILTLRKNYPNTYRVFSGLLFGLSAIAAMSTPLVFEEGIIYDGRSVVIALSGLYGGGVASLIASLIAGSYRIILGGPGVYAGVASVIVSALSGLVVRRIFKNEPTTIPLYGIVLFAVITHVLVLLCQLLLPWPRGITVIATIGIQYLIVLSSGLCAIALIFKTIENRTLALQNLQASADLLHDVLSVNPSVVFSMDPSTKTITWISPNVEVVLGYKQDDIINTPLNTYIHKDDVLFYDKMFEEPGDNNFISVECRIITLYQTVVWGDIKIRVIRDEKGKIAALFGSISDITQRKKVEHELKESEERYRTIFKNSKAVMLIIDPDTGDIVDANEAAVEFYGWSRKELQSMQIQQINTLTPEEIKARMEEARACKRVYFEFKHRRKDGNIRDVDVYSSAITIKGKQYLFSIIHDVTAKRQAEEALKKSEELFRLIFQNAPMGIYAFDENGVITACNDNFVKIIGSFREALIGLNTLKLPDERVVDAVNKCLQGIQSEYNGWYKSVTADKITPARALFSPLIVENKIVGGLAIVEDMTYQLEAEAQKEKLEEQLRQAQKLEAIGRLVGGIAHDFNNILSIISGYAELIKIKIEKDNPIYSDLEEISNATKRSAEIVRQLLTFSRQQKVNPIRVNPNYIIMSNEKMLAAMVGENVKVQLELADDVYDIWIDTTTFVQILTNLASNSRDAIKDVGNIKIITKNRYLDEEFCTMHPGCKPGDYAMIQFIDDGSGMDKETLERLFEPFFTTKEVGKGTGLGLSTVYGIVKQFNGFINVYSEPGKGTVVNIFFPKYVEQLPEVQLSGHVRDNGRTEDRGIGISKNKILVVEDDLIILDMIKKMLLLLDQEVDAFSDPLEMLQVAENYKNNIDILITDIVMPQMNGIELFNRLKLIIPDMKVIFISGYSDDSYRELMNDSKPSVFLQKPFTIDDLRDALLKLDQSSEQ